jgi:hypothetical protein
MGSQPPPPLTHTPPPLIVWLLFVDARALVTSRQLPRGLCKALGLCMRHMQEL